MAYKRTKVQRIVNRVRRHIDQFPFGDENKSTATHNRGSVSGDISDAFIIDQINTAAEQIIGQSKLCHVYDAEKEGTSLDLSSLEIVRLLDSRVFRSENGGAYIRTDTRRIDQAQAWERGTGKAATAANPAHVWNNGKLRIYPGLDGTDDVKFFYVGVPGRLDTSDEAAVTASLASDMPLDERFETAFINYVASSCFQRLRRLDMGAISDQVFDQAMVPYRIENTLNPYWKDREVSVEY